MAEVIPGGLPPRRRTDWERFADGQPWRLERGADFDSDVHRARRAFNAWCGYHKRQGRSSIVDLNHLVIQIQPIDAAQES